MNWYVDENFLLNCRSLASNHFQLVRNFMEFQALFQLLFASLSQPATKGLDNSTFLKGSLPPRPASRVTALRCHQGCFKGQAVNAKWPDMAPRYVTFQRIEKEHSDPRGFWWTQQRCSCIQPRVLLITQLFVQLRVCEYKIASWLQMPCFAKQS